MEEFAAGVASTIYKARLAGDGSRVVAVKSAASKRKFTPEPHDIIKEINLLKLLGESPHENVRLKLMPKGLALTSFFQIVEYIGSRYTSTSIELWTSWFPYGLEELLDCPRFTVAPIPTPIRHLFPFDSELAEQGGPLWKDVFKVLCKSIIFQTISGLAHLHGLDPPIALRDVKPKNLLMEQDGTVKIIDYGIAFQETICADSKNFWPEKREDMYCDVATGCVLHTSRCPFIQVVWP